MATMFMVTNHMFLMCWEIKTHGCYFNLYWCPFTYIFRQSICRIVGSINLDSNTNWIILLYRYDRNQKYINSSYINCLFIRISFKLTQKIRKLNSLTLTNNKAKSWVFTIKSSSKIERRIFWNLKEKSTF